MSLGFPSTSGGLLIFMFDPKAYVTDFQFYYHTVQAQFFLVGVLIKGKPTIFFTLDKVDKLLHHRT
jgi:hypothetical protein